MKQFAFKCVANLWGATVRCLALATMTVPLPMALAQSNPIAVALERGERYESSVPDTLTLSERARLAVNGLTGVLDAERNYMPYHRTYFSTDPPHMDHVGGNVIYWTGNELWGKHVEVLTQMRIMSGSIQNIEMDLPSIEGMVDCIDENGIYWAKIARIEDGEAIDQDDHAPLLAQARVMIGLMTLYQLDPNPRWKELVGRMAKGLSDVAIHRDDYAYYPDSEIGGTLCMPRAGWKDDKEPQGLSMHEVGWHRSSSHTLFAFGGIVQALCRWHRLSGDPEALEFAGKLVRFMLKDRNWRPEATPRVATPAEMGQFEGHLHATARGLWALLDYAELTGDERIKSIVRSGYEYSRQFGIHRIGLFIEGCAVGDMTNLAIRLTDAGVGDYWDDVDRYVRNHLVEIQALNPDHLRRFSESGAALQAGPWMGVDDVIERNIGNLFADSTHLTTMTPGGIYCCTENGLIAYYHTWEAIVRGKDDWAQVNLLLNRASPWLDVESHLPYEGKVVLRVKSARRVGVRLPGWVEASAVRCSIDGLDATPLPVGRYLLFENLEPRQSITLTFPVKESIEIHRNGFEGLIPLGGGHTETTEHPNALAPEERTRHTMRFRGNTLVDVTPREEGRGYPIYEREGMLEARTAPMRAAEQYVAPVILK